MQTSLGHFTREGTAPGPQTASMARQTAMATAKLTLGAALNAKGTEEEGEVEVGLGWGVPGAAVDAASALRLLLSEDEEAGGSAFYGLSLGEQLRGLSGGAIQEVSTQMRGRKEGREQGGR